MNINKFIKSDKLIYLSIFFILFFYFPLIHKGFEQDEWHNIGVHIIPLLDSGLIEKSRVIFSNFLPLTQSINYINYSIFGINSSFPAFFLFILIGLNCIVWYRLILKFTNNNLIAIGSLLFGYFSYISVQSITWIIPALSFQLVLLLVNFSLLLLLKYLESKRNLYLYLSIITSFLVVLTRFNGFFIFLLLPIVYFIYTRGKKKINYKKHILLIITLPVLGLLSFIGMYITYGLGSGRYGENIFQILLSFVLIPLKSISQILIQYPRVFYEISNYLSVSRYRLNPSDIYNQTIISALLAISFSLVIIIMFYFIVKPQYQKFSKILLFGIAYYLLSLLMYSVDKFSISSGFLESRYYSPAVFSVGILASIFVVCLIKKINTLRFKRTVKLLKSSIFLLVIIYFIFNMYLINNIMHKSIDTTQLRLEILESLSERYQEKQTKNLILYIKDTGNNVAQPNATNIYFQTGVLYQLIIYLYKSNLSEINFINEDFWNPYFIGAKIIDGKHVGVFIDEKDLEKYLKENRLSDNDVLKIEVDYSDLKNNKEGNVYDFRFIKYKIIN